MRKKYRTAIIISASSDIGTAIAKRWLDRGWQVLGTYRTESGATNQMRNDGIKLIHCDLSDSCSVSRASFDLRNSCPKWDVLVVCPGTQDPVGSFAECNFKDWEESIRINFINQLMIIHELLPTKNSDTSLGPCVLLFAGGGTNNAPVNYSAYIVSKIALIKMCELLDAEILDTRFVIVGPGWVKTKIHDSTLRVGARAGANYKRTKEKLAGNGCTPMGQVLDCCDWLVDAPREVIGGRNFSVVFDKWGSKDLEEKLTDEYNMYKLRRFGNDWTVK
jgi:NAD(P)-dependent dehydrogenase (short-subunit alcohol dehydrogenase family)